MRQNQLHKLGNFVPKNWFGPKILQKVNFDAVSNEQHICNYPNNFSNLFRMKQASYVEYVLIANQDYAFAISYKQGQNFCKNSQEENSKIWNWKDWL